MKQKEIKTCIYKAKFTPNYCFKANDVCVYALARCEETNPRVHVCVR
jgi:hypothetical protein